LHRTGRRCAFGDDDVRDAFTGHVRRIDDLERPGINSVARAEDAIDIEFDGRGCCRLSAQRWRGEANESRIEGKIRAELHAAEAKGCASCAAGRRHRVAQPQSRTRARKIVVPVGLEPDDFVAALRADGPARAAMSGTVKEAEFERTSEGLNVGYLARDEIRAEKRAAVE
jgi:hypothetical protein